MHPNDDDRQNSLVHPAVIEQTFEVFLEQWIVCGTDLDQPGIFLAIKLLGRGLLLRCNAFKNLTGSDYTMSCISMRWCRR